MDNIYILYEVSTLCLISLDALCGDFSSTLYARPVAVVAPTLANTSEKGISSRTSSLSGYLNDFDGPFGCKKNCQCFF